MWFHKTKKSEKPVPPEEKWVAGLQEKIVDGAKWLGERTASFSKRTWLVVLGLFCLTFGLWSLAVIYSSVTVKPSKQVLSPKPVSVSRLPIPKSAPAPTIPKRDMEKVARFQRYFDSLPPAAKDSLLKRRPGLFDTVAQLKKLYAEQVGSDSIPVFNNP